MRPPSSPRSTEPVNAHPAPFVTVKLFSERDIVTARQRARHVAKLLGFDGQDRVRIATAVSELAREGLRRGGAAAIEFAIEDDGRRLAVRLCCAAPAANDCDLRYADGVIAAQRILGNLTTEKDTTREWATFVRTLPHTARDTAYIQAIQSAVAHNESRDFYDEFQSQNQELLETLHELRQGQEELAKVNRELEETNRGVVALYAELEETAESLRRAGEQKTRFYSGISHELRTPVTSILSLARMLLDRADGELTEEQERQVSLIRNCGQNLLEWVNDLLDVARADAGRLELRLGDFAVRDMFAGLRGVMRPLVANPQVALVIVDPPPSEPFEMHSDEGKLSQVLRNLVSNALKFTERGEVRVEVEPAEGGDCLRFAVKDTGIGIAPEHIETIFDEFVQVDSPIQARSKGSGLGLAICRRFAALLGGTVEVTSQPSVGSTFSLIIPRRLDGKIEARLEVGAAVQPPHAPPARDFAPTILVIDDDPAARYLLKQALAPFRAHVVEAENGTKGKQLARELLPHAIFLDLNMPDTTGYEVLETLRQAPETRQIPVVIYSSQDLSESERERISAAGAVVLRKSASSGGPATDEIAAALAAAGCLVPQEMPQEIGP